MNGSRVGKIVVRVLTCMLAVGLASCARNDPEVVVQASRQMPGMASPETAMATRHVHVGDAGVLAESVPASPSQPTGFHFGEYIQYLRTIPHGNDYMYADYKSIVTGDFNGDGRADIVVLVGSQSVLDVYLQRANGTFGEPIIYRYEESDNISPGSQIVVGDFNGDGIDDVAFHQTSSMYMLGRVGLLLSRPGQTPKLHVGSPDLYEGVIEPGMWTVLDVDGDGFQDLVLGRGPPDETTGSYVQILHGDGAGNFLRRSWRKIASFGRSMQLLTHDIDVDGILDLVVEISEEINLDHDKGRIMVLHGLPDGGVSTTPRELHRMEVPIRHGRGDIVFGDIDGNGWKDTVFGRYIYLQVAKGKFEGPYSLSMARGYPETPLLGDFDGDGKTDLINHQFENFNTIPYLAVYLQRNGTLVETFRIQDPQYDHGFPVSYGLHPYAAADFNGDGCLDVAIALNSDGLAVLPGRNCTRTRVSPPMSKPLPPTRLP